MLNQNDQTTKAYFLPNDPKHVNPLSHDDYITTMREYRRLRKRLERIGECNAPFSHQCFCDCVGCPYRTNKATMSLDALLDDGYDPAVTNCFEDRVIDHIIYQQAVEALYKLDPIDRIIILAKHHHCPELNDRETAEFVRKELGRPYSDEAVRLRKGPALERLRAVMRVCEDD